MKPFDAAPEFIDLDNRTQRVRSPISKEQMHNKHEAALPPELVRGKRILDLGSCLGATGHWCLSHGASSYVGVEVQEEYVRLSRELLEKYHPGKYEIVHTGIEEWLNGKHDTFDVVVLFGVIYVFVDYYSILKKVCASCDQTLVIESLYPSRMMSPRFWGERVATRPG